MPDSDPRREELAQSECILYRNMFSPIFISHYKSIKIVNIEILRIRIPT